MELHWWQIYLFMRIDSLKDLFCLVSAICLVISIVLAFFSIIEEDSVLPNEELANRYSKTAKRYLWIALVIYLLNIAIPSQKQFAAIYLIPKVVNNEKIVGIVNNGLDSTELFLKYAKKALENKLEELDKEKK